jgi:hemoglobin
MSNSTNNDPNAAGAPEFGRGDASYRAAGEEAGIRKLCEDFYHFMSTLPEAKHIRSMHNDDLETMTDKLTLFLCGWLGGPRKYGEKYGPIHIPMAHRHLVINEPERDAWLLCMQKAVDRQPYSEAFKQYFMRVIAMPAEKVRQTAKHQS